MDSSSIGSTELSFEVYGVRVLVTAAQPAHLGVLDRLREDFSYFLHPVGEADIRFEFRGGAVAVRGPILFATRMCTVRGLGRRRYCDYGEGLCISAENRREARHFVLWDDKAESNPALAYEAAYTTLLSAIGEALDLKGYHRVHALGFERHGQGWLVLLPSGGGKSTTCARLLNDPEVRILSDEMPLIRDGMAYPFPIRMALKPEDAASLFPKIEGRRFERRLYPAKLLFPIPFDRIAQPVRISRLILNRPRVILWFANVVVGLGLVQMTEHMLRFDALFRLVEIALRRLGAAVKLMPLSVQRLPAGEAEWWDSLFMPGRRR